MTVIIIVIIILVLDFKKTGDEGSRKERFNICPLIGSSKRKLLI